MELRDLLIFDTVAELGGVTRASSRLNMVQSNVTTRIKSLEHAIGSQLFVRSRSGMELTDTGVRLRPYVARIAALVREAESVVRDAAQEPSGALRVGAMETTMAIRLPKVLLEYKKTCPKVALDITTGPTRQLTELVLEGRLDCAFVAGPVMDPAIEEVPVFREELVIVTANEWDTLDAYLAAHREVTALMFREGCSYRQRFLRILPSLNVTDFISMEFGTLDGILGCVAADVGIAMVPRSVVADTPNDLKVRTHSIGDKGIFIETALIRRREAFLSLALRAFRDALCS